MSLSLIVMRVLADHALASVSGPVSVPLGLAFGAGVLSTLNPCGFALLPAYVSYAVKQQVSAASAKPPSGWQHLLRGGLLGHPLAAGFLLVFLVAGGVLALGGRRLVHLFPWLAILVGAGLVLLGGWTLFAGRAPEIPGLGAVAAQLGPSRPGGRAVSETLVLLAVALAATELSDLLRAAVFPLLRWVMPVASLFLIAAGLYIVVYQLRAGLW